MNNIELLYEENLTGLTKCMGLKFLRNG